MFILIVPYRDRAFFKEIFLKELPEYIKKHHNISPNGQDYKIVIVEQKDNKIFNLSLARNVGAMWAKQNYNNISHFIFHDIDMIPIKNIDYATPENFLSFLYYGSSKIKTELFFKVNGYNPLFLGWGHEDHEFYERITKEESANNYKKLEDFIFDSNNYCYYNGESICKDLSCEYSNISLNSNLKWLETKESNINFEIMKYFSLLKESGRKKWISKFGLNLINIKMNNQIIDKNDFIINLEYDSTYLDSKIVEKIRHKL